jgi:hypothetical protein
MKIMARRCGRAQRRNRHKVATVLACSGCAAVVTSVDGTWLLRHPATQFRAKLTSAEARSSTPLQRKRAVSAHSINRREASICDGSTLLIKEVVRQF